MIARTPEAPYYAVVFTSLRTANDYHGYAEAADRMVELASQQPGFLGVESARGEDGLGSPCRIGRAKKPSFPGSITPNTPPSENKAAPLGTKPAPPESARLNGRIRLDQWGEGATFQISVGAGLPAKRPAIAPLMLT